MIIHRVKTGQTPESIAEEYGIPVQSLLSENGLTSDEPLVTGQELVILVPEVTYTVKTGDSLYSVADEYGTPVNRLLADNPSLRGNPLIYPGQTLVIKYSGEKSRDLIVNGYAYPFIDEAVLRSVLPYLTYLTVFTYGFREDGSLIPADDAEITGIARSYGVKTLLLISTLGEDGKFNNMLSTRLFSDTAAQERLIGALLEAVRSRGYSGVEVDFEYIPRDDANRYVLFLTRLADALHAGGYRKRKRPYHSPMLRQFGD